MHEPIVKPGFVIAYIPTNKSVTLQATESGIEIAGEKWLVDTDEHGDLACEPELEIALDRIKKIREMGGDACLLTIIE